MNNNNIKMYLGNYQNQIDKKIEKLINEKIVKRIWEKDYTVWSNSPKKFQTDLIGYLAQKQTLSHLEEINSFC
ncbi:MAG: hypothetical protein IPO41_13090 [Acidobacteria bacterium]|nr:hypothetical protein [Acidobacteriota bacterium]